MNASKLGHALLTRNAVWWLVLAGAALLAPLMTVFVTLPVLLLLWIRGATSERMQRLLLGPGTTHPIILIVTALACLVSLSTIGPSEGWESADDEWLLLVIPAFWLGQAAISLAVAGLLGWTAWARRALGAVALANAVTGTMSLAVLVPWALTVPEEDSGGYALRDPLIAAAVQLATFFVISLVVCRSGLFARAPRDAAPGPSPQVMAGPLP